MYGFIFLILDLSQPLVYHGHGHCVNARCRCVHTATIRYLHSVLHLESHLAFHLCCSVSWAALTLPLVLLSITLSSLTISFRECQILNCRARVSLAFHFPILSIGHWCWFVQRTTQPENEPDSWIVSRVYLLFHGFSICLGSDKQKVTTVFPSNV